MKKYIIYGNILGLILSTVPAFSKAAETSNFNDDPIYQFKKLDKAYLDALQNCVPGSYPVSVKFPQYANHIIGWKSDHCIVDVTLFEKGTAHCAFSKDTIAALVKSYLKPGASPEEVKAAEEARKGARNFIRECQGI